MEVISTVNPTWLRDAAVLLGGLSLSYYIGHRASKKQLPLPPGPKGWPIIGNALDMPLEKMAQGYAKWGKDLSEYSFGWRARLLTDWTIDSDIVSASAMGKVVVVLNSIDKALDLLDKRSTKYSSR